MKRYERVEIWGRVLHCFLQSFKGCTDSILSPEETIELLFRGKSLIRFGDGEFGIYRQKNIHYQKWSPELQAAFEAIKDEYEADYQHCSYLLAVPKKFLTVNGFRLMKKRVYVSSWAESRYDFKKNFRHDILYGDSFLFEKSNKEVYSRIWKNEVCPENVIFIHNSEVYAEYFKNTYNKKITFIQCPPRNSFEKLGELEAYVRNTIEENHWTPNDVMLTISAGPAGKVLAFRMSKSGYWCIDAGHCWDDPLEGI